MMNAATRMAPASERSTRPQDPLHRQDSPQQRECADDFERILRQKIGARGGDDGDRGQERDDAAEETPRVPEGLAPPSLLLLRAAEAPQPSAPRLEVAPVAQAAFAAARAAELAPQRTDAAGSWELSVREPLGVPLELRATRAESPAGGAPWTLTLSSSALDAGLLNRHAQRLDERLRKRLAEPAHLRIERDDEAAR